jgi:hypothetical protein
MKTCSLLTISRGVALAGAVLALAPLPVSASFKLADAQEYSAGGAKSMSQIAFAEGLRPVAFLNTTEIDYIDIMPLGQLAPAPDSTTALFGLALLGFCTLARLSARGETGHGKPGVSESTPR